MTNVNTEFEFAITEETSDSPERVIGQVVDYNLAILFVGGINYTDRLIDNYEEIIRLTGKRDVNPGDVCYVSENGRWVIFRIHTLE